VLSITQALEPPAEPHYNDFPSLEAYRLAWYTWRAISRDGQLNPEEHAARWDVIETAVKNRLYG
jgi:hypothetical protein